MRFRMASLLVNHRIQSSASRRFCLPAACHPRPPMQSLSCKWVVRIFELHDGFKQPAAFVWRILKELERLGAPSERIRFHGTLPNTSLHYTVTEFFDGIPLTDELCRLPEVRQEIVDLYRNLRGIAVPDTVETVEDYMRPRLEHLERRLSCLSPDIAGKVGQLSPLSDFCAFHMVVSHCTWTQRTFSAASNLR
ncbi:hypothetical protein B0H14DRAFT_2752621 [Mycena olivaceomarginata]|nr:hypothetical protein B0H14DRAFT_2752621 [Mycena olivaceomarginata]